MPRAYLGEALVNFLSQMQRSIGGCACSSKYGKFSEKQAFATLQSILQLEKSRLFYETTGKMMVKIQCKTKQRTLTIYLQIEILQNFHQGVSKAGNL